jgi:hypothetical protein
LAEHSEVETAGVVERAREREGRKQQVRDNVARPVNRSVFHSHRQNSRNWISITTSWTGDSQESLCQVVLRHGPRAQVLLEGRERGALERVYLSSHQTPDRTD